MRNRLVLVSIACLASPAFADHMTDYASPDITEIRTDYSTGYRALVGMSSKTRRPYLLVERVSRSRVVEQIEIDDVRLGGRRVPVDSFASITLDTWRRGSLGLEMDGQSCTLSIGHRIAVRCSGADATDNPPPPPPAPSEPTMGELDALTGACNSAFEWSGTEQRDRCVASARAILKTRHKAKAAQVVTTCKDTFTWSGPEVIQTCIATAALGSYDPVELVAYCKKNNEWSGPQKQLSCIKDTASAK